ncbi:MAG TPA: DMT family transporter [Polyangiaceae bacterium]
MKARTLPYVAVAFAACAWGPWGLIIRRTDAIGKMPVALESTIVMAVITIVTGLTSVRDRVRAPAPWRARAWVAWLGVSDAMNILLFFAAYKITIAVSVLTHYLTPVIVAVAAPVLLKEPMSRRTVLAIAGSFVGLAVLLAPSANPGVGVALWASAALGAGSAVFYASNVVVNKFVIEAFSTSETMFWHGVVGTPFLAAFVPASAWSAIDPRAAGFLALATIGPGALAGLAFVWGLRRMPAAHASTLTLLEPLVSIVLGAAVLGERLAATALLGGALILAGAVGVMTASTSASVRSGSTPATRR